jgi:hypothetical protein
MHGELRSGLCCTPSSISRAGALAESVLGVGDTAAGRELHGRIFVRALCKCFGSILRVRAQQVSQSYTLSQ